MIFVIHCVLCDDIIIVTLWYYYYCDDIAVDMVIGSIVIIGILVIVIDVRYWYGIGDGIDEYVLVLMIVKWGIIVQYGNWIDVCWWWYIGD